MTETTQTDQLNLPQHARPLAVQARLLALLEGLGVPHAPTWLSQPVSEFYKLGETFAAQCKKPSGENSGNTDSSPVQS